MEPAPFHAELAEGPEGGHAVWALTSDEVRVRLGFWPHAAAKGTVVIFPGRTEYIEKYGRVARDLGEAGFASAAIDWRGQGLADRLADNPLLGHVRQFTDYQRDAAELLAFLDRIEAPRPLHLLAHSMGGAVGLRSLIGGWRPAGAVFSAPMWGIFMPVFKRPVAHTLPAVARRLGRELSILPGGSASSHILATGFAENLLTHDRDHYDYFVRQLEAVPEFQLAAPSLRWLGEALAEMRQLYLSPRPDLPVLTLLGDEEEIVDPRAIGRMHRNWPEARLEPVQGARHEILMETADLRGPALSRAIEHWRAAA